ncbi:MAG: response regulator [Cyanothece sp. SIO1E1]|nr:response regulator [Cyanothece sp. SIO1E1]
MSSSELQTPIDILLVEDNAGDVFLLRECFAQTSITHTLHPVEDGEAALAFLNHEVPYTNAPRPDLILLDLNLPKKDGREVLAELKAEPELQSIPVIVLTGSAAEQDIHRSYQLHANCYITKPSDLSTLHEIVQAIELFWFTHVRLPSRLRTR